MADEHATHAHPYQDHRPAGPNFQAYLTVFYVLCVLTAASFGVNFVLGQNHTSAAVIVLIAIVKAVCVAGIFMHLRFDWNRLYCIVIPVSILAVMMMIVLLPDIVLGWHQVPAPTQQKMSATEVPVEH